jgi:adenylosuccinate synthase
VPGWKEPLHGLQEFADLPQAFKDYLLIIEDLVRAEAAIVSTGVERGETVFRDDGVDGLLNLEAIRRNGLSRT